MIFAAQYRLPDKDSFIKVFKNPLVKVHQANLILLGANNIYNYPRLGLAIQKKHIKRAVDRSLIKRIIRESFRNKISLLPARDLVVLSKPGLSKLDRITIRKMSDNIFTKVK